MATVETIIVGGGIGAGNPFTLGAFPYIANVNPPIVIASPLMSQVTGANQAVVISASGDPQPAATEVLRVRGGMICEGVPSSVQIGEGATTTVASNGGVAIGFGATSIQSAVVIGKNASTDNFGGSAVVIGANAKSQTGGGEVVIGAGASCKGNSGTDGSVAIGLSAVVEGGSNTNVAIAGATRGNSNRCTAINSFGPGTAKNGVIAINANWPSFGNVCVLGSFGTGSIHTLLVGEGETLSSGVKTPLVIRTTDGSGANNMGKPLTLQPGMSTGTGVGGDVTIATGAEIGAGSTLQVSTPRLIVRGNTGLVEVLAPTSGVSMLVHGLPNQAAIQINADAGAPGAMFDFNTTNTAGGGGAGTLTNAPTAGDPTAWIPVLIGGVPYKIPAWPV